MTIIEQIQALLGATPAAAAGVPRNGGATGSWGESPLLPITPKPPAPNMLAGLMGQPAGNLLSDGVDRGQLKGVDPSTVAGPIPNSPPMPTNVDPNFFTSPARAGKFDAPPAPAADPVTELEEIKVEGKTNPVPMPTPRPAGGSPDIMNASLRRNMLSGGQTSTPSIAPTPAASVAPSIAAPEAGGHRLFNGMNEDLRDRLRNMLLGMASGRDLNESFRNAALFVASGEEKGKTRASDNQTRAAAVKMGLDPQAAAGMDGKTLASYVINRQLASQKGIEPTDDIREYQYAKTNGFEGSFSDWQTKKRGAGDEEFGLNPIYGTNEKGETVLYQPSKKGGLKALDFPSGVKPSTGVDKIDLGTQWGLQDKKSGQIVGYMPKDVAGEAAAKATGSAQGSAAAEVGAAEISADSIGKQIQQLKDDPDLPSVIGPIDGRTPNYSAESRRVQSRIDQLKGGAFLQAFQMLKGGGAITEVEGTKAGQAMARMDQAQSEEDFKQALDDFNDQVRLGLDKLKARAGQGGGSSAPAPASRVRVWNPATGTLD